MIAGAAATILFASLSFVASVPEPISFLPALRMQIASSFLAASPRPTPARWRSACGSCSGRVSTPARRPAVGLSALAGVRRPPGPHGAFLLWVGSSDVGFELPQADVIFIVITVVLSASGLAIGLVPAVRRRVLPPLVAQARNAASSWPTCSPTRCGSSA